MEVAILLPRKCLVWLLPVLACRAGDGKLPARADLTAMSLEELMNVEVTSVSKKEQRLSRVPAAVFVITQEDIRRSGATSIPEALRLAPGLEVARLDDNKWAISSRGFNDIWANKLLVLMDGRSIYTPLFSGVYWDAADTLMEDIDRIEVIRGPGATMWGANAVNGVINIITKSAKETQGGLAAAGGGTEERGFGSFRHGGTLGDNFSYRVYSKYFQRDNRLHETAGQFADDWHAARGGFRVDWDASPADSLTMQGDIFNGRSKQDLRMPFGDSLALTEVQDEATPSGNNLLARWRHRSPSGAEMDLQVYYDHTRRREAFLGQRFNTVDADFQYKFSPAPRHEVLWGLGYRSTSDKFDNTPDVAFTPNRRHNNLFSAFVQVGPWSWVPRSNTTISPGPRSNPAPGCCGPRIGTTRRGPPFRARSGHLRARTWIFA